MKARWPRWPGRWCRPARRPPSSLASSRFELGLGGTWSGLRLAAGYRRWSLTGVGYGETFQGPVLTLGGWLDPEAGPN